MARDAVEKKSPLLGHRCKSTVEQLAVCVTWNFSKFYDRWNGRQKRVQMQFAGQRTFSSRYLVCATVRADFRFNRPFVAQRSSVIFDIFSWFLPVAFSNVVGCATVVLARNLRVKSKSVIAKSIARHVQTYYTCRSIVGNSLASKVRATNSLAIDF